MRRKNLSLFWVLIFITLIIQAKQVDFFTAKNVANNFASTVQSFKSSTQPNFVYKKNIPSTTIGAYYVFNISSIGFIIVSGDDISTPILAYSTESTFDTTNIPEQLGALLEQYSNEINSAIASNINISAHSDWKLYNGTAANKQLPTTQAMVNPLITTKWGQKANGANKFCPGGSYTGCVATAMAQVIKYHNYPEKGTYHNQYAHKNYGSLYANFNHVYAWQSMPNSLSGANSTAVNEVARLLSDCGISVNMCYSTKGSGATIEKATESLKQFFKYDPARIKYVTKGSMTFQAWSIILVNELDQSRPILYAAQDSTKYTGHAFILDGYDNNDKFHVNWGWDGQYNGYFSLTALSVAGQNYTDLHRAVIGIKPQMQNTELSLNSPNNAASTNNYKSPIQFNFSVKNTGTDSIRGIIRMELYDIRSGGLVQRLNDPSQFVELIPGATQSIQLKTDTTNKNYIAPGKYVAYAYWHNYKTGTPAFLGDNYFTNGFPVEVCYTASTTNLSINSAFASSNKFILNKGGSFSVKVSLKNTSGAAYSGTIAAAFFDKKGNYVSDLQKINIALSKDQTKTFTFKSSSLNINDPNYNSFFYIRIIDNTNASNPIFIGSLPGYTACTPAFLPSTGDCVYKTTLENSLETLSISNLSTKQGLVYPNPCHNEAFIKLNQLNGTPTQVEIRDILGNIVYEKNNLLPSFTMETGTIPAGIYIVTLKDQFSTPLFTQKLQIIH